MASGRVMSDVKDKVLGEEILSRMLAVVPENARVRVYANRVVVDNLEIGEYNLNQAAPGEVLASDASTAATT